MTCSLPDCQIPFDMQNPRILYSGRRKENCCQFIKTIDAFPDEDNRYEKDSFHVCGAESCMEFPRGRRLGC